MTILARTRAVYALVWLLLGALQTAQAVELRCSVDGRPSVRQVGYVDDQPVPEPAAEPGLGTTLELSHGDPDLAWLDPASPPCVYSPFPLIDDWSYWGRFDFLLWWQRDQDLPPLVTTSPVGTPLDQAGILGQPTTQTLYGRDSSNGGATAGGRVLVGAWTDCTQTRGFGVQFYSLGTMRSQFDADSTTTAILARPFYNLLLDVQDADVVTFPLETTGGVSVSNTARVVGGDAFLRRLFYADTCHRIDLMLGYQAAGIEQDLQVDTTRTVIRQGGSITFGTVLDSYDAFDTRNTYQAVAIGMIGEYDRGDLTWRLLAKVGLGNMRQEVTIDGWTSTTVPGQPTDTAHSGLLAEATNIGSYSRNVFTVSPEIGLNLAYHLGDHVDITAGYSFLYWNHVALPADQIDLGIDPVSPATRPAFTFTDSAYWLHGVNLGLQWAY